MVDENSDDESTEERQNMLPFIAMYHLRNLKFTALYIFISLYLSTVSSSEFRDANLYSTSKHEGVPGQITDVPTTQLIPSHPSGGKFTGSNILQSSYSSSNDFSNIVTEDYHFTSKRDVVLSQSSFYVTDKIESFAAVVSSTFANSVSTRYVSPGTLSSTTTKSRLTLFSNSTLTHEKSSKGSQSTVVRSEPVKPSRNSSGSSHFSPENSLVIFTSVVGSANSTKRIPISSSSDGQNSSVHVPVASTSRNHTQMPSTAAVSSSSQSTSSHALNVTSSIFTSRHNIPAVTSFSTPSSPHVTVATISPTYSHNYSSTGTRTSHVKSASKTTSIVHLLTGFKPGKPDISKSSHTWATVSAVIAPTVTPAPLICDELLLELSKSMSNLTQCIMRAMKPLQVCEKCHIEYKKLQEFHKYVFSDEACGKDLVGNYNEQYQLIPKYYDFQGKMWDSFDCSKCSVKNEDSPFDWVPNKEFLQFKKYLTDTMVCIQNYSMVAPLYPVFPDNGSSFGNHTTGNMACDHCRSLYLKLQHYFSSMMGAPDQGSRWCADIIYAVNETRKIWGQKLGCDIVHKDLESVIALTCFFCFMPVVFYVGTKLHSDVKERKHGSRLGYESD